MAEVRRLFAGVALRDETRAACAAVAARIRATGFAARYDDPAKYHLTLAFLGNVAAGRFEEVARALRDAAARCAAFEFSLDRLGAFPHERKPSVVYVGARDCGESYRRLAREVRSACAQLGFSFKDDAVAHVTIARVKERSRALPLIEVAPIRVTVAALALFESIFDAAANTTAYAVAGSAPLAGSA